MQVTIPKRNNICQHKDMYTNVHRQNLCHYQKQPKWSTISERKNEMWCIYIYNEVIFSNKKV